MYKLSWLALALPTLMLVPLACASADPGAPGAGTDGTGAQTDSLTGLKGPLQAKKEPELCIDGAGTGCVKADLAKSIEQPCALDADCASGLCEHDPGARCGVCREKPKVGEPCRLFQCGAGMVCNDQAVCEKAATAGEACSALKSCDVGLTCTKPVMYPLAAKADGADTAAVEAPATSPATVAADMPDAPVAHPDTGANQIVPIDGRFAHELTPALDGTCQPDASQAGADCDPTGLNAPRCDARRGLACDAATRRCAQMVVVDAGQECGSVRGQVHECSTGLVCVTRGPMESGLCVRADPANIGCDPLVRDACGQGQRCVSDAAGESRGHCEALTSSMCM